MGAIVGEGMCRGEAGHVQDDGLQVIVPAAREPAVRALAAMLRRLPGDYRQAFGVRLMAVETFTDPASHAGTVYAACNFTAAGATAGYGRSPRPGALRPSRPAEDLLAV